MAKKIGLFLLAFLLMFCFVSCHNTASVITPCSTLHKSPTPIPTPTATPEASNELQPYNPRMNKGSSKKLLGNCVLINIFLSDGESCFSTEEKQATIDIMKEVDNLLNREIEEYNKNLTLIYNLEDLSIDYTVELIPDGDCWGYDIISEIYSLYDINNLLKKYNADNLSFLFHINKRDWSYARVVVYNSTKYYNEFAVIFTDFSTTERIYAYTHEILHLFGAIDLYYQSLIYDEKREEQRALAALAAEYFPNEIMLVRPDMNQPIISDLTAYLIGWADHLDEKYQIFLEEYKIE